MSHCTYEQVMSHICQLPGVSDFMHSIKRFKLSQTNLMFIYAELSECSCKAFVILQKIVALFESLNVVK